MEAPLEQRPAATPVDDSVHATPAATSKNKRATSTPPAMETIVRKPTRKTLADHMASTIHYLAGEVAARSRGPRSHSNTSRSSEGSSRFSEPPLTHARPPATPEEVEEQLDRVLYATGQLQQLQRRGRYIAAREVRSLRRAFLFAVGEEQQYRAAVAAEEAGESATASAASSAQPTPLLAPRLAQKGDHGQLWLMPADSPATVVPPAASATEEAVKELNHTAATAAAEMGGSNATVEYSPKAVATNRLLMALEQYVDETPTSSSFDVNGACFSWRSIFHTPGERRLQSLVMSLFIFFTGIPICMMLTALCLLNKYTATLMLLYLIWMFTFGRPNHPHRKVSHFTRFFLWRYYRDYFPIRLVIPNAVRRQFDPKRSYFFVYHPHGIHTFGALINFGLDTNDVSEMLPGITVHLQTLKVNLYVPLWRQLTIWMGCGDASAKCIRRTLRSGPGQSIMLVVGGAEESLMAKPNANDLLLLKRKGFIKIALQEGTPLVPVYGFGENNVYNVAEVASEPDVQHVLGMLKHYLGFAVPLIRGRGFFTFDWGILPHRRPIVVVVGDPIEVPKIANPTSQDLDRWQAKYIEGLQKLFDAHRGIYDLEATGLRIMR